MWWRDSNLTRKIGLTPDQTKQIEDLFQQSRPKLIDLSGALQKQEAALEPLIEADHPDETRVVQQIDRIAQARAELEKARARMLLGIRGVLRQDQWKNLQSMAPPPGEGRR
jgi:protein CpxP